jgi:hypothetical protein
MGFLWMGAIASDPARISACKRKDGGRNGIPCPIRLEYNIYRFKNKLKKPVFQQFWAKIYSQGGLPAARLMRLHDFRGRIELGSNINHTKVLLKSRGMAVLPGFGMPARIRHFGHYPQNRVADQVVFTV